MNGTAADERMDRISVEIVDAIANSTGTDPLALDPPLYDVVDTDALDRLVEQGSSTRIEFGYAGHTVVVDADGVVSVDGGDSE